MKASYKAGVVWIALNDEPTQMRISVVADQISVLLLADLFHKTAWDVGQDVIAYRCKAFGKASETRHELRGPDVFDERKDL